MTHPSHAQQAIAAVDGEAMHGGGHVQRHLAGGIGDERGVNRSRHRAARTPVRGGPVARATRPSFVHCLSVQHGGEGKGADEDEEGFHGGGKISNSLAW